LVEGADWLGAALDAALACCLERVPTADGGATRSTFILSQAFMATTGLQLGDLKGQNGTDTTRYLGETV